MGVGGGGGGGCGGGEEGGGGGGGGAGLLYCDHFCPRHQKWYLRQSTKVFLC